MNEDKNGYLLLGTGEGICSFDGFEFKKYDKLDSLADDIANSSYRDNLGNIWYGFNNGNVVVWDGIDIQHIQADMENKGAIVGFGELPNANILIAGQRGLLYTYNGKELNNFDDRLSTTMISTLQVRNNRVLVGTMDGLFCYIIDENGTPSEFQEIKNLSYIHVQTIEPAQGESNFIIGTEDEGLYLLQMELDTNILIPIGEKDNFAYENVKDILLTKESDLWVCTNLSGLLRFVNFKENGEYEYVERYTQKAGVAGKYMKSLYRDVENNLWVGSYGGGLSVLTGNAFSFVELDDKMPGNNYVAVTGSRTKLWLGGKGTILELNKATGEVKELELLQGWDKETIRSLHYRENVLWIGTSKSGLFQYSLDRQDIKPFFVEVNSLARTINHITSDKENLYISTKNGIYNFNLNTGEVYPYNTQSGLPHNDILFTFIDNESRLLFATRSDGISEINIIGEVRGVYSLGNTLEFVSITQDYKNEIWTCTNGQGLLHFTPDTLVNI
ncbi:MAG: hypothetical protein MI922_24540, partial [Bacteroidales bacterium]|nr:hypothetical protein [Bacteroidales bacterium]